MLLDALLGRLVMLLTLLKERCQRRGGPITPNGRRLTMAEKAVGFVYRWERDDGEYYIGKCACGRYRYKGSGVVFKNKYKAAPERWTRYIIAKDLSAHECEVLETKLVTEETIKDPLCLNLKPGGSGGFYGIHDSETQRLKGSQPKLSMRKPIITPDGLFQTSRLCAEYYNMNKTGVLYRVKHKKNYLDWKFENE
jgi:hypothetical protein